jgi:adenosylcobinamide-GDP ribazoletransferase
VRFFPLVGCVLGGILAIAALLTGGWMPGTVRSTLLLLVAVVMTGGLHCDGLMDTADGVLSGRSPERMLEIMKDSRVGSFGILSIVFLLLVKWSLVYDMPDSLLAPALLSMAAIGRFSMVLAILFFPYARPEGMGKAFSAHAGKGSLGFGLLTVGALLLGLWLGRGLMVAEIAAAAVIAAAVFVFWFCARMTRMLGGLTGDIYGAVTELSETLVLAIFLFATFVK